MVRKVVKLDMNTNSRVRGHFARMAVYINLESPLVSQILTNGCSQRVQYESLLTIYFHCRRYGHVKDNCSFRSTKINMEKETAPSERSPKNHSMVEVGQGKEDKNYGPWIIVERRPRQKFRDSVQHSYRNQEMEKEGSRFRALNNRNLNQELNDRDITDSRHNKGKDTIIDNQQRKVYIMITINSLVNKSWEESLIPTKECPNSLGLGSSLSDQARSLLDHLWQDMMTQNLLAGASSSTGKSTVVGDASGQEIGDSILINDRLSVNPVAPDSSMEGHSIDEVVMEVAASTPANIRWCGSGVKARGRGVTKKLNKMHSSSSSRFKTNGNQCVLLKDFMVQLAENISTLINDKPVSNGSPGDEELQRGDKLLG
ncbi:hypothetical protein Goarm_000830 [Gossypium armourianum]|uniref:Zinc knuckle CX2CX4HX4C domain-containing protein n=1 Tax=Gossypium armourianum TaxID=34283 RepID=A0A7J9KB92_9ROSI|nr:hypothetical protein [Gossypium armourianum]